MARVTNREAAARREHVAEWWARGYSISGIAARVGCDWETARRDLGVIGKQAVAETDVPAQLHRLLRGAQAVEAAAWDAEQLGLVLGAVKTQVTILQALQGLDAAARLDALEAKLGALVGPPGLAGGVLDGRPWRPG